MRLLLIILINLITLLACSKDNKQSAFTFGYNYQLPFGDLANRFGNNSSIEGSFLLEQKNNVFYGVKSSYIFGNNIKDTSLFQNLTTSTGSIIGADGHYSNINIMQRGFDIYMYLGFVLHKKEEDLSGVYSSIGIGFLQHQIFIDTKNQNVPQLNEEYKKGYDYLTNGISTKSEISYRYYSPNGRFQMHAGVNLTIAYTKNKRPYLFDQMKSTPNEMNWDKLLGINIGIIIPINRQNDEKFHYY